MRALILRFPLWLRKFIVDSVETGVLALVGLPLVGDRDAFVHAIVAALAGAVISAARRAAPDALAWILSLVAAFRAFMQVGDE